jgi:hypothetical protein
VRIHRATTKSFLDCVYFCRSGLYAKWPSIALPLRSVKARLYVAAAPLKEALSNS